MYTMMDATPKELLKNPRIGISLVTRMVEKPLKIVQPTSNILIAHRELAKVKLKNWR